MNFDELVFKTSPFTCIGKARQLCLLKAIQTVHEESITGSFVECGVWKCGAVGLMALADDSLGGTRKVHGFDSFEGLPDPTEEDGKSAIGWKGALKIHHSDAVDNLRKMGAARVSLHQGFFKDSLPLVKDQLGRISILRLDGDWYSSTMTILNELYDQVSPGGFIIVDDYGHWEGCKKATDEFRKMRSIETRLQQTDYTEYWWRK